MVTPAAKKAHIRMLLSVAVLVCGFLLFAGLGALAETGVIPSWLIVTLAGAIVIGTMVGFLWMMRGGKVKCPNCETKDARFTYDGDIEYLSCLTCDFNEKTGYTLGADP